MKASKDPDIKTKKFTDQLKEHFSEEQIASFVLSLLGMSAIAHKFIYERVKDFIEIPVSVKYSLVQNASFLRLMGLVVRNELEKGAAQSLYLPIHEEAWKSEEDFEKRFIFVVKAFYEQLKKEGKA
jgi:response regulator RpfG family c-di-GMP phosphodiesterase